MLTRTLGTDPRVEVLVIEREHSGALIDGLPLQLHCHLRPDLGAEPQFAVCKMAWNLCTGMGPRYLDLSHLVPCRRL